MVDPLASDFAAWSPYNYVLGSPISLVDPDGREPEPPKTILIFYHGGPGGDGGIHNSSNYNAGTTGEIKRNAMRSVNDAGRRAVGAMIAPAATQGPGVRAGIDFLKDNYNEGDQVIVYGYSYGGDNAVNLTERADAAGIPINTLILVDSSDGPGGGLTVDKSVPDNVDLTLNIFQTVASGTSSASEKLLGLGPNTDNPNLSEEHSTSSDGGSNSPKSRGYPHTAEGSNTVINTNVTRKGVTHGNIQQKTKSLINSTLEDRIQNYE